MLAHCSRETHDRIFPKNEAARKRIIGKYGESHPEYCAVLLRTIDESKPLYRFDWSVGGWKRKR